MSSLIEGYTYDIFISYRQKDNRGEMWVSEFVDSLKIELESTFKEEISVYFDVNPHDGLLETHNVNASLKEKLKCLIFIPVISQTYCDPKCFAWQSEFAAFNKLAREDRFGRDIRLAGGNVASRILPVRIHELDHDDNVLLENELGGVLRSVDFIFKSAGVNRPLKPSDNPDKNLNKTYYRDQVNKVANAVKEIITAIKRSNHPNETIEVTTPQRMKSQRKPGLKLIIGALVLTILLAAGFLFIPKIIKSSAPAEKTIAVLPFENMSDDKEHEWFGDAMTDEIIMQLYKVNEFTVRSRNSVSQYKGSTKTSPEIGRELNVNYLIGGSAQRINDKVRIRVQLINAVKDIPVWVETFEGDWKDIQDIQSEIPKQIADKLKTVLTPEENDLINKKITVNPDAYNYYLQGNDYSQRSYEIPNFEIALTMYGKAIELDPGFSQAYLRLALSHIRLYWLYFDHSPERLTLAKEAIDKAFKIDSNLSEAHLTLSSYYYMGFLDYNRALEEVKIAEELSTGNSEYPSNKANIYRRAGEWQTAKENYYRAYELDPGSPITVYDLALTLYLMGEYGDAEKYFNKATLLNPTFIEVIWQKTLMYMKWKGNTIHARETLAEGFEFQECTYNPILIQLNVNMDIYDGNYIVALNYLKSKDIEIIEHHLFFNLKSLLTARLYNLMNNKKMADAYYDSARISLESKILKSPDDSRLYSALGIAYAGLGLKTKAIEAGKRAVELMPFKKEAFRGIYRTEDLARIYVMTGKYDEALKLIEILLSVPGNLSAELLQLDPDWKPLWNLPEFRKMIATHSQNPIQ